MSGSRPSELARLAANLANSGLGWSIYQSTQMMSFVDAWVAVGASVVISLAIYAIVHRVGARAVWW